MCVLLVKQHVGSVGCKAPLSRLGVVELALLFTYPLPVWYRRLWCLRFEFACFKVGCQIGKHVHYHDGSQGSCQRIASILSSIYCVPEAPKVLLELFMRYAVGFGVTVRFSLSIRAGFLGCVRIDAGTSCQLTYLLSISSRDYIREVLSETVANVDPSMLRLRWTGKEAVHGGLPYTSAWIRPYGRP